MNTASLRSPEGYHLPNLMKTCQDKTPELFVKFGGHPCAAGFSITDDNLPVAKKLMIENTQTTTNQNNNLRSLVKVPKELDQLKYKIHIIWIDITEITTDLLNQVFEMDPFGQDFPLPSFGFEINLKDIKNKTKMGNNKQHVKIELYNNCSILVFNAKNDIVQFFWRETETQNANNKAWLIVKPHKNSFMQKTQLDLIVDKYFLD